MVFGETDLILCGRCKAPVGVSAFRGPDPIVCCPVCGQSDTLEGARREAAQHTAHELLSRMLRTPKDKPKLFYRFVEGAAQRGPSSPA